MFVAGQPLLIGGMQKTLKTNVLLDAAISLASGSPMLGKFEVARQVSVAVMTGESGMGTIQETVNRILAAKGIGREHVRGRLHISDQLPEAENARHHVALERAIREFKAELVVIDPAYLSLPCDENGNVFKQGSVLKAITGACRDAGSALGLCHHTRPIPDNRPAELKDLAWAGFKEFARQWWMLNRRRDFDPNSDGEHELWLTVGGSAGFNSLWGVDITEGRISDIGGRRWEVGVITASEARECDMRSAKGSKQAKVQDQLNQDVAALMEAANRYPAGQTKNILKDEAGLSGTRANLAIASAIKSGKLVLCEVVKADRKTPREGFRPVTKPDRSDRSD